MRAVKKASMKPLLICCLAAAFVTMADRTHAQSIGETIGQILDGAKLRTEPPPPADFVVNSRPDQLDYSPLPTPGSGRPTKKKTPAELERLEGELNAAAASNRRRAARVKIPEDLAQTPAGKQPGVQRNPP